MKTRIRHLLGDDSNDPNGYVAAGSGINSKYVRQGNADLKVFAQTLKSHYHDRVN